MKKILSTIFVMILTCSCLSLFVGCGSTESSDGFSGSEKPSDDHNSGFEEPSCEHDYVETTVKATCTEEGYTLFTCRKCNDSYKGDVTIPIVNHTGIGTCKICGAEFDPIWKEFIDKNSGDDPNNRIVFEGLNSVVLTYSNDYDCLISALSIKGNAVMYKESVLTFAYNAYDKEWIWVYTTEMGLIAEEDSGVEGTASGRFSEWSSRSNSLNCSIRTGLCKSDSNLLDTIKELYNLILDKANAKLKECGYNITMENFGLSK